MKLFEKTLEDVQKLSGSQLERAEALVSKLMFQHSELEKLQKELSENGWTETYQNGPNQIMMKKSTAGDVYNNLSKNFLATMKQLNEMLEKVPDDVDDLEAFLDRA